MHRTLGTVSYDLTSPTPRPLETISLDCDSTTVTSWHTTYTHIVYVKVTRCFCFFSELILSGEMSKCQRHLIRFSPFFSPCPFFFFNEKGNKNCFTRCKDVLRRNIEGMTKRKPFSLFFFGRACVCQKVNRIHTLPRRAWDAGNLLLLSVSLSPPPIMFSPLLLRHFPLFLKSWSYLNLFVLWDSSSFCPSYMREKLSYLPSRPDAVLSVHANGYQICCFSVPANPRVLSPQD